MYYKKKWQVRIGFILSFLGDNVYGIYIFGGLILPYAGSKELRTIYINSSGNRAVHALGQPEV